MGSRVAIVGAGQLGSRYLQGLSHYSKPLEISVYDISPASLSRAETRWLECKNEMHIVRYFTDFSQFPSRVDVVIVASNADVRPKIVKDICTISKVDNWILEKILAQSVTELYEIKRAIGETHTAWVNTPMYHWPLYKNLRDYHTTRSSIQAEFTSFNGLICNSIHYIDFVARWNKTKISQIDLSNLETDWYPAKREGFFEVDGEITIRFEDRSQLLLTSKDDKSDYHVKLIIDGCIWNVYESKGFAEDTNGNRIEGDVIVQSKLTGKVIKRILEEGACDLPSLDQSIDQHMPFIQALLKHWNSHMPAKTSKLQIT